MSRHWLIVILSSLFAITPHLPADDKPAAKPAEKEKAPSVVGKYDLDGTDINGETYSGSVTIKKTGEAFTIEWDLGEGQKFVGIGILTDRTLSVSWLNQRMVGVMVYVIEKDGTLAGKWAVLGDPKGKVSKEKLTKKVT